VESSVKTLLRFVACYVALLLVSCEVIEGQQRPFPLLAVDTSVRNRLAEEWQQDNRYQHERGYCILFQTDRFRDSSGMPYVLYTVTAIMRAREGSTSGTNSSFSCPDAPNVTTLHTHPPAVCPEHDEGAGCVLNHAFGQQCYPSPTDVRNLERSGEPFWLIQCDTHALVPLWRTKT
jgi:hypothetical protein